MMDDLTERLKEHARRLHDIGTSKVMGHIPADRCKQAAVDIEKAIKRLDEQEPAAEAFGVQDWNALNDIARDNLRRLYGAWNKAETLACTCGATMHHTAPNVWLCPDCGRMGVDEHTAEVTPAMIGAPSKRITATQAAQAQGTDEA